MDEEGKGLCMLTLNLHSSLCNTLIWDCPSSMDPLTMSWQTHRFAPPLIYTILGNRRLQLGITSFSYPTQHFWLNAKMQKGIFAIDFASVQDGRNQVNGVNGRLTPNHYSIAVSHCLNSSSDGWGWLVLTAEECYGGRYSPCLGFSITWWKIVKWTCIFPPFILNLQLNACFSSDVCSSTPVG